MTDGVAKQEAPPELLSCEQALDRDAENMTANGPGLVWVRDPLKVMADGQKPPETPSPLGPAIGVRRQRGREVTVDGAPRAFWHVINEMNRQGGSSLFMLLVMPRIPVRRY